MTRNENYSFLLNNNNLISIFSYNGCQIFMIYSHIMANCLIILRTHAFPFVFSGSSGCNIQNELSQNFNRHTYTLINTFFNSHRFF